MSDITIFTDGSSRRNPGPGGWGAVAIRKEGNKSNGSDGGFFVEELGGGEKETTNNRMELMAALKGIQHAPEDASILVYTDSSYLINGITKWIKGWKRNGWKTKTKGDVLNKDIWVELDGAAAKVKDAGGKIDWKYVGGHVGILGNERCDHIATAFADGRAIKLYIGPLKAYDLPQILDISLDEMKASARKSSSSHSKAKAYSYVSLVDGIVEVHHSWTECEKRVKGATGARYKKALNAEDEAQIMGQLGEV